MKFAEKILGENAEFTVENENGQVSVSVDYCGKKFHEKMSRGFSLADFEFAEKLFAFFGLGKKSENFELQGICSYLSALVVLGPEIGTWEEFRREIF